MSAKMLRNGIQHNKRLPARALMFHQKGAGGKQMNACPPADKVMKIRNYF